MLHRLTDPNCHIVATEMYEFDESWCVELREIYANGKIAPSLSDSTIDEIFSWMNETIEENIACSVHGWGIVVEDQPSALLCY